MALKNVARNKKIRKLHLKYGGKLSMRQIQKMFGFKSMKSVWTIINRE